MTSHTLRLRADPQAFGEDGSALTEASRDVERAAGILRAGGTVAFVTETVYGLGVNALDLEAVAKIFVAKRRPAWDPLIVHIGDHAMLNQVAATVTPAARALMLRFWPGPLTLLLPRAVQLPDAVTAGRPLVGVRMPAHPVARALIRAAGVPIAAPSANIFGHISPTTAAHVAADLDGRIDAILDGGSATHGLESTVVDASRDACTVFRPGAVTLEQLRAVCPETEAYADDSMPGEKLGDVEVQGLPSPGLGLRHYAPRAKLILVESSLNGDDIAHAVIQAVARARAEGCTVGLMLPDGLGLQAASAHAMYQWGDWRQPAELARQLFAGLRALDEHGVELIVCPVPPGHGISAAIRDRLYKAARLA